MISSSQFYERYRKAETGEQFAELCQIEAAGITKLRQLLHIAEDVFDPIVIGPWERHGDVWICFEQLPWIDPAVIWA